MMSGRFHPLPDSCCPDLKQVHASQAGSGSGCHVFVQQLAPVAGQRALQLGFSLYVHAASYTGGSSCQTDARVAAECLPRAVGSVAWTGATIMTQPVPPTCCSEAP